jgi:hypothetical protein
MKLPKFTANGKHDPSFEDEWGLNDKSNKKEKGKKYVKEKHKNQNEDEAPSK